MSTAIVWFRNDLRVDDNPAWAQATRDHDVVVPLVVLDATLLASAGCFRRSQWLANVSSLADDLATIGGALTIVDGPAEDAIPTAADGADALIYNRAVSGWGRARDEAVVRSTPAAATGHWGSLVAAPGSVVTAKGHLSRVFTPFWKVWQRTPLDPWPEPGDAEIVPASQVSGSLRATDLPGHEKPPFPPGCTAAHEQLNDWLEDVDGYPETHDFPGIDGTSQLSAAIRHGTIAARHVLEVVGTGSAGREAFVRQLAWRDWYAHLMIEMPEMISSAVNAKYDRIRWRNDPDGLAAWKDGRTGYPIVDAGMRQLRRTGWMHNRARLITASFLVKDLLIDWREGERWFRELLADGDPSQNAGNWQWVAGTGTDAAPYFRVFNPVTQSERFDPEGEYIRTWVPELAGLDRKTIHAPWKAGPLDLQAAGVDLGNDYPEPIVDHKAARERALAAYKAAAGD